MQAKNKLAKKLLLIGWDAADWNIINPLMDAGLMPALESLINKGVMGNLATLDPPLSPMLWTSIATGHRATKHGVLGFTEASDDEKGIKPISSLSRKTKALWNIFHHTGLKSNVVGWWPSNPVEPINGCMTSNFFQVAKQDMSKDWPVHPNSVHPESLVNEIKDLRVHPQELTAAHVLPFVPRAAEIDREKDKRLNAVLKITAQAATIQAVSTYLIENKEWDFTAVYFDAIDHYCHAFMKFYPPKMNGIPDDLFNYYKDVIHGAYIFHDMMLDRLLKLAGPEATVMLISDHGFHSDHRRPNKLPKLPAAPALEHSPYGIICAAGPNIQHDERIYGATLLDITPTILTIMGLPVGKDMPGKVLLSMFDKPVNPIFIESWEHIEGDFAMLNPSNSERDAENKESLKQLVELGYIDDPGPDIAEAARRTNREAQYNLSRVYLSTKDFVKAGEILEELYQNNPKDIRYNLDLANVYMNGNRFQDAEKIIANLRTLENAALPSIDYLEANLEFKRNHIRKALKLYQKVAGHYPDTVNIQIEIGRVLLKSGKYEEAGSYFRKATELDDGSAPAYHGLGLSLLRLQEYEEAADHLLTAIGLRYHFPPAHFHLGECLFNMKRYKESSLAFEQCLSMAPNLKKARKWLINIYTNYYKNDLRLADHLKRISEQKEMIIVSGLPRSGTSMMMQMLESGGHEIFSDKKRQADDNNPRGYFEHEAVKASMKNNSWVADANNKVIKVIAQLLPYLPKNYKYKVIFMQRDLYEIIYSQQKMLNKRTDVFPLKLLESYKNELRKIENYLSKEPNFEVLYVDYADTISNPKATIAALDEFLGDSLKTEAMLQAIDEKLYRNKIAEIKNKGAKK